MLAGAAGTRITTSVTGVEFANSPPQGQASM
jgi:hypothetical protein